MDHNSKKLGDLHDEKSGSDDGATERGGEWLVCMRKIHNKNNNNCLSLQIILASRCEMIRKWVHCTCEMIWKMVLVNVYNKRANLC